MTIALGCFAGASLSGRGTVDGDVEFCMENGELIDGVAIIGLFESAAVDAFDVTDSTADGGTEDSGGVVFDSDTFEKLFDIEGADIGVGNSKDTCFVSGAASLFCSSSRLRSLFIASASSSCFSHFE